MLCGACSVGGYEPLASVSSLATQWVAGLHTFYVTFINPHSGTRELIRYLTNLQKLWIRSGSDEPAHYVDELRFACITRTRNKHIDIQMQENYVQITDTFLAAGGQSTSPWHELVSTVT